MEQAEKLDYAFLRRELDRCKSSILMDAKNAFLGALMCQLKQDWDKTIPTACTNGKSIWWNPLEQSWLRFLARRETLPDYTRLYMSTPCEFRASAEDLIAYLMER